MIDKEELTTAFAVEIKLLEQKYGLYLGGDRAGNVRVFDGNGTSLGVLKQISIKPTETEDGIKTNY